MKCYCGQPKKYQDCCEPLHRRERPADTPEQLMRSRFSAYFLRLVPYIADTYFQPILSSTARQEIHAFAHSARFLALEVITSGLSPSIPSVSFPVLPDSARELATGYVHFKVWFLQADKMHLLEEHSRFVCHQNEWRYLDGVLLPHPVVKLGRNDLCPCGSEKKYKACSVHWLNHQPVSN